MVSYSETNRETEHRLKNLTVKILDRRETRFLPQIFVQVIAQSTFTSHDYVLVNKRKEGYFERFFSEYECACTLKYEKDLLTGFKFWINEIDAKKYLTFI